MSQALVLYLALRQHSKSFWNKRGKCFKEELMELPCDSSYLFYQVFKLTMSPNASAIVCEVNPLY